MFPKKNAKKHSRQESNRNIRRTLSTELEKMPQ